MTLNTDGLRDFLTTLIHPQSGRKILDFISSFAVEGGSIRVIFEGPPDQLKFLESIRSMAEASLKQQFSQHKVLCALLASKPGKSPSKILPTVKHIIAIASGKGGVGKSTTTVNLAVAFTQLGYKVGILDADIYGPSLPTMMGLAGKPEVTEDKKLMPMMAHGICCMSIGLLIPPDAPMVWRGPMVQGALMQLLKEVAWGELDLLLIDMPPGTGDVQLSLAQQASLTGAVIVSTPQDIALIDARKAIAMFEKVAVPVLGIIENMSVFTCPHCGHDTHIFSHGGAQATASTLKVPFLGEVPLRLDVRSGADSGQPENIAQPEGEVAHLYRSIATHVLESLPAAAKKSPSIQVMD
ncbi:Mrp/NBP35 family ATP-binding protein [Candidatus Odyssella acanthamoebae]|uniref:Iron-sulfur cluster carrier protein n=1 Tax=Candidatus Odyssella acanthamoebae TaxID=91604 RepID=A0A077AYP3_9PROT|nr:Mrp/NBP35 family ATP-binding protein [Candidatus Paracaedibacter acanthamoebae]AIK97124.1 chromosome partitioning protein ParA [Candidatus Paracaedibacter acanthamoebae]